MFQLSGLPCKTSINPGSSLTSLELSERLPPSIEVLRKSLADKTELSFQLTVSKLRRNQDTQEFC